MKKSILFLLFAVFSAIIISSCSNNDPAADAERQKNSQKELDAVQQELDSLNKN